MKPSHRSRHAATLTLAIATALVLGGLAVTAYYGNGVLPAGTAGTVHVTVTGPDAAIWDGAVPVHANATALDALHAAADAGGFDVKTREYAMGTYVYAIAGHEAEGASGWVYEVERDGTRAWADRAADQYPVTDGDGVHWAWSDSPPG